MGMTKTEILKAAQRDDDAITKLIETLKTANQDGVINLIDDLITAVRLDTADDIRIDLKSAGLTKAQTLVENEYL